MTYLIEREDGHFFLGGAGIIENGQRSQSFFGGEPEAARYHIEGRAQIWAQRIREKFGYQVQVVER